jgi:hypothetical protein
MTFAAVISKYFEMQNQSNQERARVIGLIAGGTSYNVVSVYLYFASHYNFVFYQTFKKEIKYNLGQFQKPANFVLSGCKNAERAPHISNMSALLILLSFY